MKNLTEGKPLKVILNFAIPLFIGQLFHLCYSLIDTRIVGETLGETALAAVGSTTSIADTLGSVLNGFSNGAAIVVATYFGARERDKMKKTIGGTLLWSIGLAMALGVLCLGGLNRILDVMNIEEVLLPQSKAYISVILAGLVASTLYNALAAILRAVGDSITPLMFLITATLMNVILDYAFVLILGTGVEGVAFATVIAQVVSAGLCLLYMKRKYPELLPGKEDFQVPKEILGKILKTGFSMSFMGSFVVTGTLALQTTINTFGTNIIVAHTAARKATGIFMLPFGALGQTMATYCGQNLGAGRYDRIRQGVKQTVMVTFVWCIGVIVVVNTICPVIIQMITATTETEIIQTATQYLRINTALYFVPAVISLFRNAMQGFGDSVTPVFSSSLELICKVLVALFLAPAIGYMGIIVSEPISWVIMVIPLILSMVRYNKTWLLAEKERDITEKE